MERRVGPATTRDLEVVERWWQHGLAHGALAPDVEPVLTRLVRTVGRGSLPDGGLVFVKLMAFPRLRHRLRYALRSLPACREAHMLSIAHRAGIVVPRPVAVWTRRDVLPRLSMLVTEALDVAPEPPGDADVARAAAALATAGIYHPDLNPGNFLQLTSGQTAVLDLQSARALGGPLRGRRRAAMAAKLLSERTDCTGPLVDAGLIDATQADHAQRDAAQIRLAGGIRRIRRCLQESTEFAVRRRFSGTWFERRALAGEASERRSGGRELIRMWVGERALEVLEDRPPMLRALFRKSWWLPGRHSVYICAPSRGLSPEEGQTLLWGYERLRAMTTGRSPAVRVPADPA